MADFPMARPLSATATSDPSKVVVAGKKSAEIARINASRLMIILFFQEVVWLTLNRIFTAEGWTFYYMSEFKPTIYAMMIALAALYSWGAGILCRVSSIMPRWKVGNWIIVFIFVAAIIGNAVSATFLSQSARYTEGGLTGAAGAAYAISRSFSLMSMVLALKSKYGNGHKIGVFMISAFSVSLFITIDGLAGALTTCSFLFLMFRSRGSKNIIAISIFILLALLVFYVGFNSKFKELPYYMTPEFAVRWSIARMSISAESLYTYLSGGSIFNKPGSYIELLERSYVNRYLVIMGESFVPTYPRSVSEGFFYDMYRDVGAGSSPGFYLGTLIHGIFSPIILFFICYIFVQMFYGMKAVFGFADIFAITFITKIIHANVTEYIIFFSPATLALFALLLASLMTPKISRLRETPRLS